MTNYQSRNLLFQLIICSLSDTKIEESLDGPFEEAMALSVRQNVVALAFDGLQKNKAGGKVNNELKLKWIGHITLATQMYAQTVLVEKTISKYLYDKRIKALVLKGTALSQYYKIPELRQFSDIDIFSLANYNAVDELLKALGSDYQLECYRHSQCVVQGVSIENHIYLTDARWQKRWSSLESYLKKLAEQSLYYQEIPGLCYPDYLFTIIFFVYHALSHFVYDRLNIRFLVDWYCLLMKRNVEEDNLVESNLIEYGLMPMAAALTALCIKWLNLKDEEVPREVLKETERIQTDILTKIEDDMFDDNHTGPTSNSLKDRIHRISTFIQYRWKIEQFLGISVYRFICFKIIAILTWQIKEKSIKNEINQ